MESVSFNQLRINLVSRHQHLWKKIMEN